MPPKKKIVQKRVRAEATSPEPEEEPNITGPSKRAKTTGKPKKDIQNDEPSKSAPKSNSSAKSVTDSNVDEEPGEDVPSFPDESGSFGSEPTFKTYYLDLNQSGISSWVEKPPKNETPKSIKQAEARGRAAIVVYKVKDDSKGTFEGAWCLKINSVQIQSPILTKILDPLLQREGIHLDKTQPTLISEPFKPLFFCYDEVMALNDSCNSKGIVKEHLALLAELFHTLFDDVKERILNLKQQGLIAWDLLWTLFPKGTHILDVGNTCAYQVESVVYRMGLLLCRKQLCFKGEKFVWRSDLGFIPPFHGNCPLAKLSCIPMDGHPKLDEMISKFTARAKNVIEFQDIHYREYSGVGIHQALVAVHPELTPKPTIYNVDGRILIDFFGYKKYHQGLNRTDLILFQNPRPDQNLPSADVEEQSEEEELMEKSDDRLEEAGPAEQRRHYVQRVSTKRKASNIKAMLSKEEELIYVSPYLEGFDLKSKLWMSFHVDDVKPLVWNDDAYGHLVFPEGQKDLLLTFVDNHKRLKAGVDDVVKGKGEGLVVLLSGPPGTGKTLSAEAVSDKTRRPLYYIHAEELGTDSTRLGAKLKKIFELAVEWDAVILLDEADVFMAKRSPNDILRNELVSIFLREIEYFSGILFLTTNLFDSIDNAFRSRVNIHLLFEPLSFSARLQIWQKFLVRFKSPDIKVDLSQGDVKELARWVLNGRESKNAAKMARTWCLCKNFEMNLSRLESGINVTAPQATKEKVDV